MTARITSLALALAGLILAASLGGSHASSEEPSPTTREALAQVDIDVEPLTPEERDRISADGITSKRARRIAMAEYPSAESAEAFSTRFVDPSTGKRSLAYVVVLESVQVPLFRGYDPEAEDGDRGYVTVRYGVFIDAMSGEVLMGTNF